MKYTYFLALCLFGFLATSCEESEEEKQLQKLREHQVRIANQRAEMQKSAKNAEKKRAERDAKGDTLAMSSVSLASCLPTEYNAYKKNGEAISSPPERNGNAFSSVEQTYTSNNQNIRIIIRDSNKGISSYAGVGKMWVKTPAMNNKKVKASYVKMIDKFHAWQYFEKKTRRAGLQIEVSDRIYIEILATEQQDTEDIKAFAQKIDLAKLGSL